MKKLFEKNNNGNYEVLNAGKTYPLIEMHWDLFDKRKTQPIGKYNNLFYSFNTTVEELQGLRIIIVRRRNYE